ncbi:hypothetical protein NE237_028216 [Protea cynaroides]|uniref:RRM domain-containing protein n=1 Tax=Protea cynaroides TaxID=273540 RepID=A0A9Q0GTC8_9MAGN|nr:hypothetical protein NE237_028216 [Protea cynaroides]
MLSRAANKKGASAGKKGPRGKKATAVSKAEVTPFIVSEDSKDSESLAAVVVEEDSKMIEEVVEEKSSEIVSEESLVLNGSNVKKGDDMHDKEEAGERNDGEKENGAARMDLDQDTRKQGDEGAKQNVVEEETAAAEAEDTKGGGEVEDTKGDEKVDDTKGGGEVENNTRGRDGGTNAHANGTVYKLEEVDKSGTDGEDDEEEEDPSIYMEIPLTDRKKDKEFEIFVGGLDKEAVEKDLINIFGEFGEILSARIAKHPTTQKSKGFAFIRYATVEQARKVLIELKDGIEVRGKRVGLSASQDNDTLYMGNICKTWTKEQVLETLKSFQIEQIDEIYLPDDPKIEGKNRGFALVEFSTHSDAMTAFQRLRKPDAVFGCDRSAKVAFAQSSIHPSEEALSQVKTVFIEGLTDSWDEEKVKELCKQYGEIERVQLSRNLGKKRKDFCFVAFASRESAVACVEGINNAQIGEGDVKVKANLAKPQNKGRLAKRSARGGFKVNEEGEKTEETGPSKTKGHANSKGAGGKGKKTLPKLKNVKGGKSNKPQGNLAGSQGIREPSSSERTNLQRNRQPHKVEKRGKRDMDNGYDGRSSKKARGIMHGRPPSRSNNSHSGKPRQNYSVASTAYQNHYAQGYAASSSRYQGHTYAATSGSKRQYSDMEPHAGYIEPAARKQSRDPYSFEQRRPVEYDFQGSSGVAFGRVASGSVVPLAYGPNYSRLSSYAGYEGTGGSYRYPSSAAYLPRRAYY